MITGFARNLLLFLTVCIAIHAALTVLRAVPQPSLAGRRAGVQPPATAGSIFRTAPAFSTANYAPSVATGDFNKDGILDLVVANGCPPVGVPPDQCATTAGGVSVLLGNGDGTFQPAQSYLSGGDGTTSVAVSDVNRDGKADIVVSNTCLSDTDCSSGGVAILIGKGDGSFQAGASYPTAGYYTNTVMVRDLNGDGKPDLIVVNPTQTSNGSSGSVAVLLGKGDGTFQAPLSFPSGGSACAATLADFNGDGKLDLAVANQSGGPALLLGNGDGTFQPAVLLPSGGIARSIASGDFNGDHKPDLVVTYEGNAGASGVVSISLGNGDGTFQPALNLDTGAEDTRSVLVTDFNGDGKLDVAVTVNIFGDIDNEGAVVVMLGNGDGTFRPSLSFATGGAFSSSLIAADFNRDGRRDLAVANRCLSDTDCPNSAVGSVAVLLGKAQGVFAAARAYLSIAADSITVGDFNGDGNPDFAVVSDAVITVFLGSKNGTFQTGQSFSPGAVYVSSIRTADFNGDGKLDLVVASTCATGDICGANGSAGVSVLLGNGDGTFQAAQRQTFFGWYTSNVTVGDFNGDGKPDIAVAVQNNCRGITGCQPYQVSVFLGNGDGTFLAGQSYPTGGVLYSSDLGTSAVNLLTVGDFNGDGKLDLALVNPCVSTTSCSNGVARVFYGNGDGTFKIDWHVISVGHLPTSIAAFDFNGDGKTDLAISGDVDVSVVLGNGDGTFQAAQSYPSGGPGYRTSSVAVADFNSDGKPDLLVANPTGSALFFGNGDGTFQSAQMYDVGGYSVAVGDFNHDGRPDAALGGTIILQNTGGASSRVLSQP